MIGPSCAIGGGAADEQSSSQVHDQTQGCDGRVVADVHTADGHGGGDVRRGLLRRAARRAGGLVRGAGDRLPAVCVTFVAIAWALDTLTCVTGP